jgi:hypothetical protein
MTQTIISRHIYTAGLIAITLLLPITAQAESMPEIYSPDSFATSYHDKPLSFERDKDGNFSGMTESGKTFTQVYVTASISVRLQKFSIDKVAFYVSDQGIIEASSDISALSIYLAKVGWYEAIS